MLAFQFAIQKFKDYNIKCTNVQALGLCTGRTAHRGSGGIALLFHDDGTKGGEGSASRPGRSLPPGKTRYSLHRRLGGPQGRSGQVRKISPPPGFDSRTVQPVANRYTDYAARPTDYDIQNYNIACCFNVCTVHILLLLLHPTNGKLCITTVCLYMIHNCALVGSKKQYCLL